MGKHCRKSLLAGLLAVLILTSAGAPFPPPPAGADKCDRAAREVARHAERRIRRDIFLENLKRRLILVPFTIIVGVVGKYLMEAVYVLPAIAPEGFKLKKKKRLKAIGLERALHYSGVTGTRLERLEDKAIARTIFDVGMCYYRHENWSEAARYLEELRSSDVYEIHVGREKLLFLLGECYYMAGRRSDALKCYREFLRFAPPLYPGRKLARRRIDELASPEN